MWGILKRKVEKDHVSNIQQLRDVIMEEWKRMPTTTCAALVNSMPRRIKVVLDNNGAPTKLSWVQAWHSSLSPAEVAISLPLGLMSLNSTHLPLITLPAVPHHHKLLVPLTPTTLSGLIVCVCYCICYVLVFVVVVTLGIHTLVAVLCIPFLNLFSFFALLACLLFIKAFYLLLDPDFCLRWFLSPPHDKMKPANMGPTGKFLDIRQGDRSIEDYAEDFVGMASQSATEKICLMVMFWGGLADPFKSMMPYWAPEESRACSVLLAHRVRSRARSVPGAHRVRSRARSVPGAHRVRSRARS